MSPEKECVHKAVRFKTHLEILEHTLAYNGAMKEWDKDIGKKNVNISLFGDNAVLSYRIKNILKVRN